MEESLREWGHVACKALADGANFVRIGISLRLTARRQRGGATLRGMDEKVDILDSRGEKTGEVAWKSEAHRLGLWHRCFHCWIFSPGIPSGGPYLFVQRRAAGKDTWPNRLDVTAAGHLGAGEETLEGGLREIEEELGLTVAPDELVPLGTRRSELQIPAGLDREFQEVFLLVRTLSPKDLRLQEEEVVERQPLLRRLE